MIELAAHTCSIIQLLSSGFLDFQGPSFVRMTILEGEIIGAHDPANVGRPISIAARSLGNGMGSAVITIGTVASSPNLVVNAIIAVLIALLVPALGDWR